MVSAETIDAPEPGEAEQVGNGFSSRAPPSARLSRWARELRQVSARCLSGAPGPFAPISAASVPAVAAGSYALGPGWHGALPTSCRLCHCLASHRLQQRRVAGHASTAMLDPAAHTRCKRLEVSCPTDTFARHAPSAKIAALCPSRSGGRVAPYCGFMDMVDPHVLNGGIAKHAESASHSVGDGLGPQPRRV